MADSNEYTLTMAQVYAVQGHWDKAVEIYSYLVAMHPDRQELQTALTAAKKQLAASGSRQLDDLTPLLRTWFKLQTRYHHLRKLKRVTEKMSRGPLP